MLRKIQVWSLVCRLQVSKQAVIKVAPDKIVLCSASGPARARTAWGKILNFDQSQSFQTVFIRPYLYTLHRVIRWNVRRTSQFGRKGFMKSPSVTKSTFRVRQSVPDCLSGEVTYRAVPRLSLLKIISHLAPAPSWELASIENWEAGAGVTDVELIGTW